jgi:uncharacterized repeat protein (TIGR01451 family)
LKGALLSWTVLKFSLFLLGGLTLGSSLTAPALAEGSREMVADGGDRPFTEWTTGFTAGIPRQTLLQVYVQAGETVYFGSSVYNSANGNADIVYRTPSGQQYSCNVRSNNRYGWIDSLVKEAAGPEPLNANGYRPCEIDADETETGLYEFEFHAPSTTIGQNPPTTSATEQFPTNSSQNTGVAAWDITVVNNGAEQKGRVFTNYVALNMGNNGQNLASDFYIQTWDGYLYRTDMNDVDPFGFIFYGNSKGFLDSNGTILYHSVVTPGNDNSLSSFAGGATVQDPTAPNNPATNDYTHLIFFNPPAPETLAALGISPPVAPQPPADFRFVGADRSDNQTLEAAGGYFEFTVPGGSSYRIILDTNTDGVFDTSTDVVLEDALVSGYNRVDWDGNNASGSPLPARTEPYEARIVIRSGEYHFPMLDAEYNESGFIIEMLNAPMRFPALNDKNGEQIGPFTVYYDDGNYVTASGTEVILDGSGATAPREASQGVNSRNGEHEFTSGYGNFKGIDTWAYFPSEAVIAPVIVTDTFSSPGLSLVKRITAINGVSITRQVDGINSPGDLNHVGTPQDQEDNHTYWPSGLLLGDIYRQDLQPGDEVEFTVYFLSHGDTMAQKALFCDLVPQNMAFLPDAYSNVPAAKGPSPLPGVTTAGERGIVLGVGTQSTTSPYPILVSLSNASDGDAGQYVAPGVELTTIDARLGGCGTNNNGAIVVHLDDLPPATSAGDPPGAYGFIRFTGRIN